MIRKKPWDSHPRAFSHQSTIGTVPSGTVVLFKIEWGTPPLISPTEIPLLLPVKPEARLAPPA